MNRLKSINTALCWFFLTSVMPHGLQGQSRLTSEQWNEDINYIVETIEREHPNPYWRVSKEEFYATKSQLESELERLTPLEVKTRMIQLVARLQDGHTDLIPYGPNGFTSIFPVRMYRFSDGLFITAITEKYKQYAGAQVLKIGDSSAEEALKLSSTLWNNENEYRKLEGSVFYLTSPEALKGLNVISSLESLPLELKLKSGRTEKINIQSEKEGFDLSFGFWGEMWGPGSDPYVTGIDNLLADDYYNVDNESLPLHLRYRSIYWFKHLKSTKTLYVQLNGMGDSRKESFTAFLNRLWQVADQNPIERFVLDLRYNVGGDGSKVNEFVHGIIKRDQLNRPDRLFTVLGRATFSAGVNLAAAMQEHTNTNFIGSPAGAYYNHNGDAESFSLPNSQMELSVSTIWHQPRSSRDRSKLTLIDIPIEFSSEDYFGKRDPVLDFIIGEEYKPVHNLVMSEGASAGIEAFEDRKRKFQDISWWRSMKESDWNQLGYDLSEEDRKQQALAIFQYNVKLHPKSWKACDSLAEIYAELGNKDLSVKWYKKALEIAPMNFNAEYQREMIEKQSK